MIIINAIILINNASIKLAKQDKALCSMGIISLHWTYPTTSTARDGGWMLVWAWTNWEHPSICSESKVTSGNNARVDAWWQIITAARRRWMRRSELKGMIRLWGRSVFGQMCRVFVWRRIPFRAIHQTRPSSEIRSDQGWLRKNQYFRLVTLFWAINTRKPVDFGVSYCRFSDLLSGCFHPVLGRGLASQAGHRSQHWMLINEAWEPMPLYDPGMIGRSIPPDLIKNASLVGKLLFLLLVIAVYCWSTRCQIIYSTE